MSEYHIECERALEPLRGDYWSAIFGVYEGDRRIQEVEVTLSFRALDILSAGLRDRGVERDTQQIVSAVLCTEGERRIREQLGVPGRPCDRKISVRAAHLAETGKVEEVLRQAGLL